MDRVVVVVNSLHSASAALFRDANFELIAAPDAELGMGHSLAYGVSATATAAAWLVCLADMPCVCPRTLATVVGELRAGIEAKQLDYGLLIAAGPLSDAARAELGKQGPHVALLTGDGLSNALREAGVTLVEQEVGGRQGRKMWVDMDTFTMKIKTL